MPTVEPETLCANELNVVSFICFTAVERKHIGPNTFFLSLFFCHNFFLCLKSVRNSMGVESDKELIVYIVFFCFFLNFVFACY